MKPFFESKSLGVTFQTPSDWYKYAATHPESHSEVVNDAHGFKWNVHNTCLNPKIITLIDEMPAGESVKNLRIETAQLPDGGWVFGLKYDGIMEDAWAGGGGAPNCADKNIFASEDEAIKAALRKMLEKDLAPKYRRIIQTVLNQRRVVQLTLF